MKNGETHGIAGRTAQASQRFSKFLSGIVIPDKGTIQVDGKVTGLLELGTGFNAEMTGLREYLHEPHTHRDDEGKDRAKETGNH